MSITNDFDPVKVLCVAKHLGQICLKLVVDIMFGNKDDMELVRGTSVTCILTGGKSSNGNSQEKGYANGTAPGSSKLAFFDMKNSDDDIGDPEINPLLASL